MSKPRVLIIENSIAVTGALQSVLRSSTSLKDQYDFFFLIPSRSTVAPFIARHGFESHQLPMLELRKNAFVLLFYFPRLFSNAIRFFYLVKKQKADLILVNDFYNLLPAVYKVMGGRLPYVCYVRFMPSRFSSWLVKGWVKIHHRYSSGLIAVSEAVKRELPLLDKVTVVYNEIPLENILYSRPSGSTILYPANYTRGKGQEHALNSFSMIFKKFPIWRLRFVGGDMGLEKNRKFKVELMALARTLDIEDRVEWLDFSKAMQKEYQNACFVVNFSESESFSLTCLEALYFGRPVIATRCGGPEEIIDENKSGLLVKVGDVPAMADAMSTLMGDRDLLMSYSAEGFKRVRTKFSTSQIMQLLHDIFQHALHKK